MKSNKTLVIMAIGVLLGFLIGISNGTRRIFDSPKDKEESERKKRWDEEEQIEKQFNSDFDFVCDRIRQRDLEVYSLAEKHDRELLVDVERLSLPTNNTNQYRVELETQLKRLINHHIQDCIRMRSRIQECRGWRSEPFLIDMDIYDTKCDCECCAEQ